jgi:carbon starvation protein
LTVVFTVLIKKQQYKWCWIPGVPLVWDLIVTLTASYQKIFSPVPAIGYWAQHSAFQQAQDSGAETFGTASSPAAIAAVVRNTFIQGTLSIIFATLVILVVIAAAIVCIRSIRAGGMPTTEEPDQPSHTFAPRSFLATPVEKRIAAEWAKEQPLVGAGHRSHH